MAVGSVIAGEPPGSHSGAARSRPERLGSRRVVHARRVRLVRQERVCPGPSSWARPAGLAVGVLADRLLGDPRSGHPVALYGSAVDRLERRLYADDRARGALFTGLAVAAPLAMAVGVQFAARRTGRCRGVFELGLTAAATWAVLGGESLAREGLAMAVSLEADDLTAGRARLRNLCARDATGLGPDELARATVESLGENASDAVVAPLLWGAVGGVPGLVGYRAVNTLDAMVGYRSARYRHFGWASARTDDIANLAPSRLTAILTVLVAPSVGGSSRSAWSVWRRDARHHPSPNAGHPEAAFAGGLGVRLGGRNAYAGKVEARPVLGEGEPPAVHDVRRAVLLGHRVTVVAAALAVVGAAAVTRVRARVIAGARDR